LATLTPAEQASIVYDWSNPTVKTLWSNLPYNFPSCTRNGLKFGALSTTSRAAALTFAKTVLSTQGYAHLIGVFAADDFLDDVKASGDAGGPAAAFDFASDGYHIAFIGAPSIVQCSHISGSRVRLILRRGVEGREAFLPLTRTMLCAESE